MNILFLSLCKIDNINSGYIYADIIKEFVEQGHNVYAMTPFNNTTDKRAYRETLDNCNIIKVKAGAIQKTGKIKKVINLILLEKQTIGALKKYASDVKFDLVIPMVSSLCLYRTAKYIKKRDNAQVYMLLKDIFPQNAVDMGMMSKRGIMSVIYKFFAWKEKRYYAICDYIGCLSPANVALVKDNYELKNCVVEDNPNSVYIDEARAERIGAQDNERNAQVIDKYHLDTNKTMFLYGGNLGKPQGIDFIIECIDGFEKRENAYLFIIGGGTEYGKIEAHIKDNHITNTLLFKAVPQEEYDSLVSVSDVGLVFLDKRFTVPNYPSRTLSYMAAKLPIVFATDAACDAKDIAEKNNYGFACISGDSERFFEIVDKLASDKELRVKMGENAYQFLLDNYSTRKSYDIIMSHFGEEK